MLDNKEEDLERLAELCLSTAKQIKEHLASTGHPQMTFDQNGPQFFPQDSSPMEIQLARLNLRAAAKRLHDLVSGPDEVVVWNTYDITHDLNAFRYAAEYSIAAAVPLNSTISYSDLATKLSLDRKQLRQMLRQLIQIHVFSEPTLNQVSHTASSKLLITHEGVAAFNGYIARDVFPMAAKQFEALEHFGHGNPHPHEAGLNFACKTNLPMFAYYEQPEQAGVRERFSKLMTYASSFPALSNSHLTAGFRWSTLPPGSTIVDIAGNVGHCSIAIARATDPTVKLVVQDLPQIVARAKDPATSVVPADLRDRFTFMEHDFYTPQPIQGAAVYFLRMIMHDYSDAYCWKILRQIVPAMGPDSRIVIMDQVSPPVGVLPTAIERMMRTQDLQMMLLLNARERDIGEWNDLVAGISQQEEGAGKIEAVETAANSVVEPEEPKTEEPKTEEPKTEEPKTEEPKNEEAKAEDSTSETNSAPAAPGGTATAEAPRGPPAKRLEIKNIVSPPGTMMSLIEIGFVAENGTGGGSV
ncbi:uncharacterized protein A1O9_09307 [Exophiala aquamarina CBS 119918]|uniref:O-methyltransferase C-terminal domain-containing protein n=1 Tax=Exophiala aquamarina CBS 119918 TaxID=1182545 RepID=A0A072P450_9EURO|nr:uncharacterized protein A1O9_09307 [Exophiala aquamarina CBS 119918]KEF54864.1 hypothetical protein A1O9_09307 [Exophiala aquamarina CBS 119918]